MVAALSELDFKFASSSCLLTAIYKCEQGQQ